MGLKRKKGVGAMKNKPSERGQLAHDKLEKLLPVPDKGPHFIGLDLGTVRSAVVTSWGERSHVESVVGWPKDVISVKILGDRVYVGEDALKNRLALEIVYPLDQGVIREGAPRHEEAAIALVKHLIDSTNPPAGDIYCVVGAPAEGVAPYKALLSQLFKKYFKDILVVPEPFAVAYALDLLKNTLVVDIGGGTSDICRLCGTIPKPEDLRTITKAGNFVDEQLYDLLVDKFPDSDITMPIVKRIKEQHGYIGETKEVNVDLLVKGLRFSHEIGDELQKACSSILPDIIEGIKDEIATFDPDFQEEVRNNIILAGGMGQIPGLGESIQDALEDMGGGRVSVVEDPLYVGAEGGLKFGQDIIPEYWKDMGKMLN